MIAKENSRGISVIKWHDKHDVLFLLTKHTDETLGLIRRNEIMKKPTAITDYNSGKSSIYISD